MIGGSVIILNGGAFAPIGGGDDPASALRLAMARLQGEFFGRDGRVNYRAMLASPGFAEYLAEAWALQGFDPASLGGGDERLAFWLNLYNALVIHGVVALGIRRSTREVWNFSGRVSYLVGGHRVSLEDIEHGILRANRRGSYRLRRPFGPRDPRRDLALPGMDPRIHFALNCGARSCPPIVAYDGKAVREELELAAEGFINSPEVEVLADRNELRLSRIFAWYKGDFVEKARTLPRFVLRFLDKSPAADYLTGHLDDIRVRFRRYDWSLNHA